MARSRSAVRVWIAVTVFLTACAAREPSSVVQPAKPPPAPLRPSAALGYDRAFCVATQLFDDAVVYARELRDVRRAEWRDQLDAWERERIATQRASDANQQALRAGRAAAASAGDAKAARAARNSDASAARASQAAARAGRPEEPAFLGAAIRDVDVAWDYTELAGAHLDAFAAAAGVESGRADAVADPSRTSRELDTLLTTAAATWPELEALYQQEFFASYANGADCTPADPTPAP